MEQLTHPVRLMMKWKWVTRKMDKPTNDTLFVSWAWGCWKCCPSSEQLSDMLKVHLDEVVKYCRPGHTKMHGTRKGAALHATSGTTVPPPLPSVANHGEWSQGAVFDVYFLFAEPGDQYLGQCLAGLDPNLKDFAVLPPHFNVGLEDEDVAQAMSISFADIGDRFECTGILAMFLASMIHNIGFIC